MNKNERSGFTVSHELMRSRAYQEMSAHTKVLLFELWNRYRPGYDLVMTYTEAEELMNRRTFMKALDELVEHGFITVTENNWHSRRANRYSFSTEWTNYDNPGYVPPKRRDRVMGGVGNL